MQGWLSDRPGPKFYGFAFSQSSSMVGASSTTSNPVRAGNLGPPSCQTSPVLKRIGLFLGLSAAIAVDLSPLSCVQSGHDSAIIGENSDA